MGMNYFGLMTGRKLDIQPHTPYKENVNKDVKAFLLPTAKDITLAEYSMEASGTITAHRLADYRHHNFSLVLLPDVPIWMDKLLEKGADEVVLV